MRRVYAVFAFYAAVSIALFGRDVVRDPRGTIVGDDGADKTLYLWSLEWWPWALRHGHNPLDVHVAWAPHGFDFGLGTAGAALALAAAPLTSAAGAVVSYNALMLAAPALAATTAFALARHICGQTAPAVVAGWVFGFSSYEVGRVLGHLPLAFVALVPIVALLVVLRYDEEIPRHRFVVLLSVTLGAQFWIVTQIYFTLAIVSTGAAVLALAVLGWDDVRPTVRDTVFGWLLSLPLIAPAAVYALFSDAAAPARSPFSEATDLLNLVVPTRRTLARPPGAGEIAERFTGTGVEQGAYLGIPLLLLAALALRRQARRGPTLVAGLFIGAVALSLGTRVKVAGSVVAVGPWSAFAPLPVIGSAVPARFMLYASLFAALLVAIALADVRSPSRWGLAVVGIALTLPNLQLDTWSSRVPRANVVAAAAAGADAGATTLVLPYGPGGWSMHWQAMSGFRLHLVGGHFALRVTPSERPWRDVYEGLNAGRVTPERFRRFLDEHAVDMVVVAPGARPGARRLVDAALPGPPRRVADGLVYVVRRT